MMCNFQRLVLQQPLNLKPIQNGTIEYKDWTTGAINLSNYIGQRINIQVTAHGCTKRNPFWICLF